MRNATELSAAERRRLAEGAARLARVEQDAVLMAARGNLPPGWAEVAAEEEPGSGRRTRVTLAMDARVLRWFKSMGPGHLKRMERVLTAYMEFRLARAVKGAERTDILKDPKAVLARFREEGEVVGDLRTNLKAARDVLEQSVALIEREKTRADHAEAALRETVAAMQDIRKVLGEQGDDEDED